MKRYLAAALAALCLAAPTAGQTISGCRSVADRAVAKSIDATKLAKDVACFEKAGADAVTGAKVRRERMAALTPSPKPTSALAGIIAEGDSISAQWLGSYTGLYAKDHTGFSTMANGGARISDTGGGNGLVQRLPALLAKRPAVVTVLIGANDLGDGQYPTLDAWLAALWSYVGQVKATGAKVYVGTVLPICVPYMADYNNRHKERRPAANAAIRAAVGSKIDGVIDFAADPVLGDDEDACGKAYKDGIHPADDQQPRMEAIYERALTGKQEASNGIPAPIASNFDRSAFIERTGVIPKSAAPDVVGAFRFICQAGQVAYADPIAWPGQPAKSHLHQFFGNTLADANSTFQSLRTTGDSTCMNVLNRSAYWMSAMLNGKGQVIRPDYISVYYKRLPASSPECARMAKLGCVGLPNGIKMISGFDHSVSGPQPKENMNWHWRCVTNQIHRDNVTDAIADCGGEGQVIATVSFGSCWNGQADSADHRSHVVHPVYDQMSGLPGCPAGYDRIIPELTQSMAWTILRSDGAVRLSSDHEGDKPGATLHADYMTAWDQPTLDTAMANCIDKMLNASDGDLCDGTIMKRREGFGYTASPRLVAAPR